MLNVFCGDGDGSVGKIAGSRHCEGRQYDLVYHGKSGVFTGFDKYTIRQLVIV